jgi:ABC-2 type transport system ATP-binding protein
VTVDLADRNGSAHEAVAVVHLVEGASEVVAEGHQVRARVPNGAQAIPLILSALEDGGFPVAAVTTARPSLDDVYLHYTGRDFSTEDEEGKR